MKRFAAWVIVPSVLLSGCASTVEPVSIPLASSLPAVQLCSPTLPAAQSAKNDALYVDNRPRDRLQYLVCALHRKANQNLQQAKRWENRTEWRDIPLLGAAATVAGLLLFGERNSDNVLKKREQETIAGIGFGAAAFATFTNYLSPQRARDLLRKSARGNFCLATQGEFVLAAYDSVERKEIRAVLRRDVTTLSAALASNPAQFGKPDEVRAIRDAANLALATYDAQLLQLNTAGIALGESAWNFGLDLMSRSDRDEKSVEDLVKAISDQTASVTKFAGTERKASDPVPPAVINSFLEGEEGGRKNLGTYQDGLALSVASETAQLLDGLVNVEALVLGFDKCAATALAGGAPRADKIQRVNLP